MEKDEVLGQILKKEEHENSTNKKIGFRGT